MFNRSQIMKTAWKRYWNDDGIELVRKSLAKGFIPQRFANCLKSAWATAKSEIALNSTERLQQRIEHLKEQIKLADYLPAHMSRAGRIAPLQRQLAELKHAA